VCTALAVSCGGSSGGGTASDDTPSTTSAPELNVERPEGPWTYITAQTARSDIPDAAKGLAGERRLKVTPVCGSGPCDLEVTPNGADGSYLPEGATKKEGSSPSEPYTVVWNQASSTYTSTSEPSTTSCTNAEYKVIPDAYTNSTTTTLTFTPAGNGQLASLTGTYVWTITSTPEGEAQGCTPFVDSGTIVATPTGALDGDATPELVGEYAPTLIVEKEEGVGAITPGFRHQLKNATIGGTDGDYTISLHFNAATSLTRSDAGWSGTSPETTVGQSCGEVGEGFTTTETFTDLQPVALTANGDPVLTGKYRLFLNPTEAGVVAGCSLTTREGYLILVPTSALG